MAVKTLTYVLLGRDELTPVARKAGANVEGVFSGLGKMAGLIGLTTGIAAIGYESVKAATSFQSSMEKIHTQAGASQKSVGLLSQSVLQLGTTAEQGPQHLSEALYHLKSIGLDNADAMKALKVASDLAAVGGADLESTTNALGGAWRSGIKGAESFGKTAATVNAIIGAGNMKMEDFTAAIGTGILPAARTFGVSLGSVGSALALMTDEGIPADEAATRLKMSLSLLAAPSGAASKQLAKIGLTGLELANTMRGPSGLVGTIGLLKDHLDASGMSASQQAILLSHAFGGGRSSSAILTLVNNLEVLRKKQDQINKTTGNYGDAVIQQRKTAQAQFAILKSTLDVLSIRLGTALLPPLTRFAQFLTSVAIPRMMEFGHKVDPVIKTVFGDFTAGLNTISRGMSMLPGPVKIAAIAIIALGVAMRLAAMANPWILLAVAIVIAVGVITKNWKTIGPVFHTVINAIVADWHNTINFLINSFHDVQNFAIRVWHSIEDNFFGKILIVAAKVWWASTKFTFQVAWDFISGIFLLIAWAGRQAWAKIVSAWRVYWSVLKPLLQIMGAILGFIFTAIGKTAANTWNVLATTFQAMFRNVLHPAINLFWTVISNVFGAIIHAAAWAFGWIPGLGPKLRDAANHFDAFRNSVNNAINGIKNKTVKVNVAMTSATNPYPGGISGRAAAGGRIRGRGGPRDDAAGLFALSHGEWVIRENSASKYGHQAMAAVNEGRAVIGYAGGGAVGVNVQAGTPGAGSVYSGIGATVARLVLNAVKSGLFGLGAVGPAIVSYARSFIGRIPYVWGGTAVPGGADCSGFTQSVYGRFGIHAPRTSEAQGAWVRRSGPVPGGLAFYHSLGGGPDPGHVAIVANGSQVISQGGGMGPQMMGLHAMPLLWTGVPPGRIPGAGGGFGNGPINGTLQQIAMSLLNQYGWGGQWPAFNALENREAGWNMNARNPSSGAYGLAQFINGAGEYAQYGGNWFTGTGQLTAMMNYIRGRYGSPNGAWAHEVAFNWYKDGGPVAFDTGMGTLRPGHQIVYNGTGRNETLSTGGHGRTYIINVTPTPLARPADNGREIVDAIKAFEFGSGKGWRSN